MNDGDDNEQRCSRSGVNPSIVLTRAGDSRYYKMLPKAGNEIDITSRNSEGRFTKRLIRIWSNLPVGLSLRNRVSITALSTGMTGRRDDILSAKERYNRTIFSFLLLPFPSHRTGNDNGVEPSGWMDDFWINCPRQRFILIFGIITKVVLGYLNPLIRKIF